MVAVRGAGPADGLALRRWESERTDAAAGGESEHRRVGMKTTVGVLLACVLIGSSGAAFGQGAPRPEKVAELRMTLRDLLVEHIQWSRMLVVASRAGQGALARVAQTRALANARAIGEAVGSFYGKEAGQKFGDLFSAHNRAVKEYMEATFSGRTASKRAAAERATSNAREIDGFLSRANPNLPKGAVLNLLVAHWIHHTAQIEAAAKGDWALEARVWDDMRRHIYTIADALAEAIGKQFAEKFQ